MGLDRLIDRKPKLDPEQVRKAKPVRNAAVTFQRQDDGSLLLEAPLSEQGRGFAVWIARKMKMPQTKKFELEPIGAFLWELIDGNTTVETLSKRLRQEYKMNKLEADASLLAFLQMLSQRRLIVMQVPKR